MALKETIETEYKNALKSKDKTKKLEVTSLQDI